MVRNFAKIILLVFFISVLCSFCGCVAHEHTFADSPNYDALSHWYEATCGHDKVSQKEYHEMYKGVCRVCGYKEDGEIKLHTLNIVSSKNPTCTQGGNIMYGQCVNCGKLFSDTQGKNEITSEQTILAPLGHRYGEEWKYSEQKHWHECTGCGKKEEQSQAAHLLGEGTRRPDSLGAIFLVDMSVSADKKKNMIALVGEYIDLMTDRDGVAVLGIKDDYAISVQLLSLEFRENIKSSLSSLEESEADNCVPAITQACSVLSSSTQYNKYKIVLVTDGSLEDIAEATALASKYPSVSLSVLCIGDDVENRLDTLCSAWDGNFIGTNTDTATRKKAFKDDIDNNARKVSESILFTCKICKAQITQTSKINRF